MTKKDKLLAEAQKMQQKGQTDKAVSCYQEALSGDPGDIRVRQRLAELLVKCRRFDEARKEFETIGRNLASSGFYLKSIAVYKQIEKMFPDDISIALTLASLNEQHGLPANALAEYKRAYDQFERLKNHAEAVKALEAMQRIDSRNPNIKLKYAEVLHQQQKLDESYEAFKALGLLLIDRRDAVAFGRLIGRVGQLFPEKSDFVSAVVEQKLRDGGADQAASLLQSLIKSDPKQFVVWRLLVLAYRDIGDTARLKTVCQHFVKFFPAEIFPREVLISCLLDEEDVQAALALLDDSESLFMAGGAVTTLRDFYLKLNDLVPINIRIMKGCARVCQAAGNSEEAASFSSKIGSLAGLSREPLEETVAPVSEDAILPEVEPLDTDAAQDTETDAQVTVLYEEAPPESAVEHGPRELDVHDFVDTGADFGNDFYEIEVELDDGEDNVSAEPTETWFDTVHDIFGNITTETGAVRFGDGMENGDSQSQFDLGAAFYEMGLFDEAINVLRQAAEDPARQIASLTLQGACLREKGELQLAANALQALLALPTLTVEDTCALKYELALTCTAQGNEDQARHYLEEISVLNPAFRDVEARLQGEQADGLDFDEDDLLDFELK